MTILFYLLSIAVSAIGYIGDDYSNLVSLGSGSFLFLGLFFDSVTLIKSRADRARGVIEPSEPIIRSKPVYGDLYVPKRNSAQNNYKADPPVEAKIKKKYRR